MRWISQNFTKSSMPFSGGTLISVTSFVSTARSSTAFVGKTRSKALHEFKLHRQEKFLYVSDTLHMWEWDVRVLDIEDGAGRDHVPLCLDGRGATPPESCGGPPGDRPMLKRQQDGAAMCDPVLREAGISDIDGGSPRINHQGPGICCEPRWTTVSGASIRD